MLRTRMPGQISLHLHSQACCWSSLATHVSSTYRFTSLLKKARRAEQQRTESGNEKQVLKHAGTLCRALVPAAYVSRFCADVLPADEIAGMHAWSRVRTSASSQSMAVVAYASDPPALVLAWAGMYAASHANATTESAFGELLSYRSTSSLREVRMTAIVSNLTSNAATCTPPCIPNLPCSNRCRMRTSQYDTVSNATGDSTHASMSVG
jgi:hypothetical protein